MYRFGPDACSNFKVGTRREWIVTNGLGGYASSTIIGANTRTYHGLLVAALAPPVSRMVILSSLDEEIELGDTTHKLASHRYQGAVYPEGFGYIREFRMQPFPTTTFAVAGLLIAKEVFMLHGHNTTVINYRFSNPGRSTNIRIFPLVNARNIHSTTKSSDFNFTGDLLDPGVVVRESSAYPGTLPLLYLQCSTGRFVEDGRWYFNFEYDMERCRGQLYVEDNYNPGFFLVPVRTGDSWLSITASTRLQDVSEIQDLRKDQIERLREIRDRPGLKDEFVQKLICASESFVVHRSSTDALSVIAGYHWFSDWGRDALISLPGLTLVTRRFDEARQILMTFGHHTRNGLVPNRFHDTGEGADYNTVDASLWFINAVYQYLTYTGDGEFVAGLWGTMCDIIASYRSGTSFDIHMDNDGLILSQGQLTWMDAMAGGRMFTPRAGKACEINALWYNALKIMEELAPGIGDDPREYSRMARRTRMSYAKFWNETTGCLYDVIDEAGREDAAVRPNQIIAVSLPFSVLPPDRELKIVSVVEDELLTPLGLRTLTGSDPAYKGHYMGDRYSRDSAYHQGTVWPWLMGPFVTAYCKVNGHSIEARTRAKALFEPFAAHLHDAGIGTISEMFDGDHPHEPRGCISQAWSVAELLRSYVEDVLEQR
ncbi:MAG: glycogen debranching enzyme N-terminal domain-containing protein [ANME-2 cluster archaeon]|nr:glycogen debranching enzyme N-terminal domain-containing protein [ANME-2 cluster archaeon]